MENNIDLQDENIYKVHCLDESGRIKKIIVFCGSQKEPSRESLFSDEENAEYLEGEVDVVFSKQYIHNDDSIFTIKNKIIHDFGDSQKTVAYDTLYLFTIIRTQIDMMDLYQTITQKGRVDFTKTMLANLLLNTGIVPSNPIPEKSNYFYEDLISILIPEDRFHLQIPLGLKFSEKRNLLFVSNPYNLMTNEKIYNPANKNHLVAFENMLLFNYGKPLNNNIYMCFAEDVFSMANQRNIDESYISRVYFPRLYQDGIFDTNGIMQNKSKLMRTTKEYLDKNTLVLYKTVDLFYDIFYKRNADLNYVERGIQSFSVLIHTNLHGVNLPLEMIFKNIHATKLIPFIKYNPGSMQENMYRLYVEKISKNGKKIPYLDESVIMSLSRKIGKRKQISMYVQGENEVYIDFEMTGNIRVHGTFKHCVLPSELIIIIRDAVNPVIENMNQFLQKSGYSISPFNDFDSEYVEVESMKYFAKVIIENDVSLQKYIKCLSALFIIYQSTISKTANLIYKRVENFKEMDAQMLFIKMAYETHDNVAIILKLIMDNFQVDESRAKRLLGDYLEEMNSFGGKFVENPGFPSIIYNESLENQLVIEIDQINHIEYIYHIHTYLDSFLRMTQNPKSSAVKSSEMNSICKNAEKMGKNVGENKLQNVLDNNVMLAALSKKPIMDEIVDEQILEEKDVLEEQLLEEQLLEDDEILLPSKQSKMEEEEEEGDLENALFYEDDEDEDYSMFQDGGVKKGNDDDNNSASIDDDDDDTKPYQKDLAGKKLKNIAITRMKKYEPMLFTTKSKKPTNYSRHCLASSKKQPIVLTQQEKDIIDRDHPGSYEHAIQYGTDPNKKHWYICPRFWCLQTNTSMTEEEVKAGKCGTKPYPHNIIPDGEGTIPDGAYVLEFKTSKHLKKDGAYENYNPGIHSVTDDGTCLPCCYKGWRTELWKTNRGKCPSVVADDDVDIAETENIDETKQEKAKRTQIAKQANYIMGIDKFPIGKGRWGLLPFSVQEFLQTDNSVCVSKTNQVVASENTVCLLRYGMETSDTQSFLACAAAMYAYKQGLDETPSIREFKTILADIITLDMFIGYSNASLVATFKPKKIDYNKIDFNKKNIENSQFMVAIDMNDDVQLGFLEETIASYENFLEYILDDTIEIDHSYLWDIVTQDHPKLMKGGYNLVILEIPKDDMRDNMQVVCPTDLTSRVLYDPTKETVILIMQANKQGVYYEPVYQYAEDSDDILRAFTEQTAPSNLKSMLSIIQKTTGKYCAPRDSLPKVYHFKKNNGASEILRILKSANYGVEDQVLNYQGKVIGFMVLVSKNGEEKRIYIPCYPSPEIPLLDSVWMDDEDLWTDYVETRDLLIQIYKSTGGKIMCLPRFKVLEDGMIVGILTETNQFVQIAPLSENIFDDGLVVLESDNYMVADKTIMTSHRPDPKRVEIVKKIDLETRYYSLFRTLVRQSLHDYENRDTRMKIMGVLEDNTLFYREKLGNMEIYLRTLLQNRVVFADMDSDVINDLGEWTKEDGTQTDEDLYFTNGRIVMIPKKHLLSGVDNETVYFARVADELLRYKRVQLFMLNPSAYLNIGYSEYVIWESEMLMLQSLLTPEYFRDLVSFNENRYLQNVDYVTAIPSVSQNYSNQPISLEEQRKLESTEKMQGELNMDCVKRIRDEVEGNILKIWKRIFPKPAREVVFYSTPQCSFSMMIYIIENVIRARKGKTTMNVTVENVKTILWNVYRGYLEKPGYLEKIIYILKVQGKKRFFVGGASLEQVIASDEYYLTDLDLWVIAQKMQLPIVLFSSTSLKFLMDPTKKTEWLIMGGNVQVDKYYFVRSPSKVDVMEYQMVLPAVELTHPSLKEFYSIVQGVMISMQKGEGSENMQIFGDYLEKYRVVSIRK